MAVIFVAHYWPSPGLFSNIIRGPFMRRTGYNSTVLAGSESCTDRVAVACVTALEVALETAGVVDVGTSNITRFGDSNGVSGGGGSVVFAGGGGGVDGADSGIVGDCCG